MREPFKSFLFGLLFCTTIFTMCVIIAYLLPVKESRFDTSYLENWCGDGQTVQIVPAYAISPNTLQDDNGNIWTFDNLEENCLYLIWTNENNELIKLWKEEVY